MIFEDVAKKVLYHTDTITLSHPDETGFVHIMDVQDNHDGEPDTYLIATGAIDTDDLAEWYTEEVQSFAGTEGKTIEEVGMGPVISDIVSYHGMAEFDQNYQMNPYHEATEEELEKEIREFFLD